ncbi:hypothetical protein [Solibacillus sp. FSL W7-1324]|uniref:hypothetical protein n=1 Tax=Solibacillus sp. FSL W7-1324 TaxID=2921701 RepID=UPI0030F830DB
MKLNSVEAHKIKAMVVNTIVEKKSIQKEEKAVSDPMVTETKEVAISSDEVNKVNNIYSVEGHLQKWRGTNC